MKIEQLHQLFLESKGITTDTRSIRDEQIFFALKGENFNGNTFAWQALKKGAGYAVIDEEEFAKDDRYILVKNVLATLQELANFHRNYLKTPILAITGSNGKTTSKEIISAILRKKFEVAATVGNLNNHIGVPLTLLSFKTSTEFGIVEMGANHHGEIKRLCEIAVPDYGYITNFGKAHLEGFGSVEGVVKAKSEMYANLKENKKLLFLNTDDKIQQQHLSYDRVFTFGTTENADIKVDYTPGNLTAQVTHDGELYSSMLTGNYNSVNIAAGICIGKYFQVPVENIQKAIAAYSPQNNRSQIINSGSTTLIMDAYNANPTSMKAALESFEAYPANKKMVILGDMFELGKDADKEHQEILNQVENCNFSRAYLVGKNFIKAGAKKDSTRQFDNFEDLKAAVENEDLRDLHILIKGSRGMALERLLEVIKSKKEDTN